MKVKTNMFLARLLIILSLFLIMIGAIVQYRNTYVMHPIDDVVVVDNDTGGISITPIDKDNLSGNKETVKPSPSPTPTLKPETPKPSPSPSIGPSPSFTPTPSPSPKPSPSPSPVVPTEKDDVPTESDLNIKLRKSLEQRYGISIKYGDETSGYKVGGMWVSPVEDEAIVTEALNELNKGLALYPSGFFAEMLNGGFPLTINLIKRFSIANVTGVTDSSNNNIVISIATDYDIDNTIHHELYHYIEKYIFSTGFKFTSWDTLNPSDFVYGTVNSDYSYAKTFADNSFFVNNYAQTDQYEDRASTFEYMMMNNKASCFNYGNPVWLKAKKMSEQIDYFFETVSPYVTEYWERFVY